jgi:hypothetical protein
MMSLVMGERVGPVQQPGSPNSERNERDTTIVTIFDKS